jgi:Alginate lyase
MSSSQPAETAVRLQRCQRRKIGRWIFAAAILMTVTPTALNAEGPRVFLLDGVQLQQVRDRIVNGDTQYDSALESLRRDADQALNAGPFSVTNKEAVPPSGDQHDYMSFAPYWWPNPDTENGLPFIHRDGKRNPDIYNIKNRHDLGELADSVDTLSVAYFFTGEEKYAQRARLLIHTWFIEPTTRMNPNFTFAQAIRGVNTGRGLGLIESRLFTKVVDAAGLLDSSKAWTHDDQQELENWFTSYLQWMLTSDHGRDEADAKNNHGTYYDLQVASFALFLGKKDLAANILKNVKTKRIAVQIEPDGRQRLELVRTKAWSYSIGNLSGLMSLARLGEHVGVDLWNYKTSDGRSIRAALDFLIPFGIGAQKWPYQQIEGFSSNALHPLLRRAAAKYPDGPYRQLLTKLPPTDLSGRSILLFPQPKSAPRLNVK